MSTLPTRPAGRGCLLLGMTLGVALSGGCASSGTRLGGGDLPGAGSGTVETDHVANEELRVVRTYAAASGRTCRRLATADGAVLPRVSCRQANGEWTLGRSLGGGMPGTTPPSEPESRSDAPAARSARKTVVPALGGAPTDADGRTAPETLRRGETLWAFASRTTGDPHNWKRIAEINGIEEVESVDAGRSLVVPTSMLSTR